MQGAAHRQTRSGCAAACGAHDQPILHEPFNGWTVNVDPCFGDGGHNKNMVNEMRFRFGGGAVGTSPTGEI